MLVTGPRALWRRIPLEQRRVGVYVTLVALVAFGLLRLQVTIDELHDLVEAEADEERIEDAEACVNSHERYAEVRGVIRSATIAGADLGAGAVAAVAGADPDQLAAGEAYIDQHANEVIDPIVATYEAPSCDVDEASRVLDREPPSPPPSGPGPAPTGAPTTGGT